MAKIKGHIVVDVERCKGCGVCVASCPCGVLALSASVNGQNDESFVQNDENTKKVLQFSQLCDIL